MPTFQWSMVDTRFPHVGVFGKDPCARTRRAADLTRRLVAGAPKTKVLWFTGRLGQEYPADASVTLIPFQKLPIDEKTSFQESMGLIAMREKERLATFLAFLDRIRLHCKELRTSGSEVPHWLIVIDTSEPGHVKQLAKEHAVLDLVVNGRNRNTKTLTTSSQIEDWPPFIRAHWSTVFQLDHMSRKRYHIHLGSPLSSSDAWAIACRMWKVGAAAVKHRRRRDCEWYMSPSLPGIGLATQQEEEEQGRYANGGLVDCGL